MAKARNGKFTAILALGTSLLGGGGSAWAVVDIKMAWLRADLEHTNRELSNTNKEVEKLRNRGDSMIEFSARISERVDNTWSELTTVRNDIRALIELARSRR